MAYEELSEKQRALLTQSHLEYYTRKAIRVFWIIYLVALVVLWRLLLSVV